MFINFATIKYTYCKCKILIYFVEISFIVNVFTKHAISCPLFPKRGTYPSPNLSPHGERLRSGAELLGTFLRPFGSKRQSRVHLGKTTIKGRF